MEKSRTHRLEKTQERTVRCIFHNTWKRSDKMNLDIHSLIIYEDPSVIVCRKPAGIPTQSSRIAASDMVSLLKNYLAASSQCGSAGRKPRGQNRKEPYLAVIHRLDQPVEGLLVFAKTPAAARNLSGQLTGAGFGKYYLAMVRGIPSPSEGDLEDHLVKDGRTNTSRVCTADTPGAKYARLHYHTVRVHKDQCPPVSLIEIRLDTGRHHQIRVQISHHGFPLIGDRKYGGSDSGAGPLKLCAYRLEFLHPTDGRPMNFELPSPSWEEIS